MTQTETETGTQPLRGIPGIGPSWREDLVLNSQGIPKAIDLNGDIALSNDAAFTRAIRLDRFRSQITVGAPLPWDPHTEIPRPWESNDDYETSLWLQQQGILLGKSGARRVIEGIAEGVSLSPGY